MASYWGIFNSLTSSDCVSIPVDVQNRVGVDNVYVGVQDGLGNKHVAVCVGTGAIVKKLLPLATFTLFTEGLTHLMMSVFLGNRTRDR